MDTTDPQLIIFTALPCEAKPIIKHFALQKWAVHSPFAVYQGDNICLIVTGVGKNHAAGAVGYSQGCWHIKSPVLLNIGIAGHKHLPKGQLVYAHKINDADNPSTTFYPQWVIKNAIESLPLTSYSTQVETYPEQSMVDMEAAGFYQMAVKSSTIELIHCLKIISDNSSSPASDINAKMVTELVKNNATNIEQICHQLLSLRESVTEPEHEALHTLLGKHHFTVSHQLKLKALLLRWKVLTDDTPLPAAIKHCKTAKEVIARLEKAISGIDYSL